ncbi:MAG: branched-chain amino acid ABC transporter permease [Paracoccaceae bacterium]
MDFINAIILLSNFIIVPALTYGSQLALGALGVTLIYSVLRFSNFSHGEYMSFGTMITILTTWYFQKNNISIYPFPTALLALPIGIIFTISLVISLDYFVFKYHREKKSSPVTFLIASIGLMFFIGGIIRFIIGPNDQVFSDGQRFIIKAKTFKQLTGFSEGLAIKMSQGITVITAILVVSFIFWFLKSTKTGKSMRAYSDNENLALLSGINPNKVVIITWVLVAILAAIAGVLFGLDKSYKPFSYMQLVLPIFASAIVGGVGNPVGAIAGGYIIAFSELIITFAYKRFFGYLLPEGFKPEGLIQILSTDYKIAVSFLILVLVLIIKPTGLFSGKTI